jgi:Ca2+-binding RTX toxin-like protein
VGFAPAGEVISGTAISADADGGFFVAWHQRTRQSSGDSLQIRAFDAVGAPRGDQFHTGGVGFLGNFNAFDLAAKPDGSGAVLVDETTQEGFEYSSVAILDTHGIIGRADHLGGSGPIGIDVAMHPNGSFVVGYERIHREFIDSVTGYLTMFAGFAQRYDAAGQKVGGEIALGDSLPGETRDKRILSVTVDTLPDGRFVAGFQQGSDQGITTYARLYDAGGSPMGGPIVVDTDPPKGHVVGADASGRVVLAYLQGAFIEDPYNPPGSGDVHVRRLELADLAQLRGAELFVDGTDGNDHIIVERVRQNLFVNVNGIVERFNAADVQFLSISGLGGDDDIINASAIPSTISGGDGADTLWGGTGADVLRGFGGNDSLRGGDGNDVLLGGTGDDTLHGGDGNDTLTGERGNDTLRFGETNDGVIAGVTLADRVLTVVGSDADDEILIQLGAAGLIAVSVNGVTTSYPFELVEIPVIFGNGGNDVLTSRNIPFSFIDGGAGDDELSAFAGRDTLLGGDGNDHLTAVGDLASLDGGPGADTLITLEGDNTLFTDDGFPDTVHGGGFERVDADPLDELIDVELVT